MSHRCNVLLRRGLRAVLLMVPGLCATAMADAPPEPVHWNVALVSQDPIRKGSDATLEVSGVIDDGWHVYALEQLPHGPTPLRVTLDQNVIAVLASPASGSAPEKVYSASFGLDTQYYTHTFAVRVPVHLSQDLPAGRQLIPLNVRFQACSDKECLLPRTLHLSLPIDVPAAG
jgi:Disulphide bond corrector protein DsbC